MAPTQSTRPVVLAVLAVVAAGPLSGCVINPGAPGDDATGLAVESRLDEPATVEVTVSRNGTVVYERTTTVDPGERWERSDVVDPGTYELRVAVDGGPTTTETWNTSLACGSPTAYLQTDRIDVAYGPC